MRRMTESKPSKADFAPAWPFVYKVPGRWRIVPPFDRVSVFNRSLTVDQLKPLTERFRPAGSRLLKVAAYLLFGSGVVPIVIGLVALLLDAIYSIVEVSESTEQQIVTALLAVLNAAPRVVHWASAASLLLLIACSVRYVLAWKEWRTSLTAAWNRYEGRIVRTKDLPRRRREKVNALGSRLESAMPQLDALNMAHCHLVADATLAIGRYIDLPTLSKDSRKVAQSEVQDESVQKVRDAYDAAEAAEKAALEDAENAVMAIEACVDRIKAAAAERQIVDLAKALLREPAS